MDGIMSINAKAQDAEEAWKFMKFINGEDWARLKASSRIISVSRQKIYQEKRRILDTINKRSLHRCQYHSKIMLSLYSKNPRLYDVQGIGYQKLQQVMEGKLQVREALKQWQTEGDTMIQKLKENPDAQPDAQARDRWVNPFG